MSRSTTDILDLAAHLRGFERHLRAANRAPATISKYTLTARQLIDFLAARGMPTQTAAVRREHVEAFIEATLEEGRKAATAATKFQALRVFFRSVDLRTIDLSSHLPRAGIDRATSKALGLSQRPEGADIAFPPLPGHGLDGPDLGL